MSTGTPDEPDADYITALWSVLHTYLAKKEEASQGLNQCVKILQDRERSGDTIKQLMGYVSGTQEIVEGVLAEGRFKGMKPEDIRLRIAAAVFGGSLE